MTYNKSKRRPGSFRAYVDIAEYEERAVDVPEVIEEFKEEPNLLPDEIKIAEANNVLKFAPLKINKTGISGTLFITNFKVSFSTSLPAEKKDEDLHYRSLQSHILGVHDIALSEVDIIYQISEGATKKRRLIPPCILPIRLHGLQLVLKNLRIVNFSFKFTPVGEDIKVCQALLHHAFPTSIDHLCLSYIDPPIPTGIPDFCLAQDWERELQRTKCPNWRVSKHNEFFNLCSSLPVGIVIPHELLDNQLEQAAHHFLGTRPPVWCWGVGSGAALVRMAQISPHIIDKVTTSISIGTMPEGSLRRKKINEDNGRLQQQNRMMGLVHKCHPKKLQPSVIDLDQHLPSLKDIQISYNKLRELHTPDDPNQYREQDRHYLSRWEQSRWLNCISKCLEAAQNAATAIVHSNSSVILQESDGRDLSALVSSLIQLLLDPQLRTLRGFHYLIQKEWVALGHPFCKRLGHTRNDVDEQCPVFLLFLDCVHQIAVQHQSIFEFTSEYLVALWHAAHCSLNSTFMFDSLNASYSTLKVLQRENNHHQVYLHSVWSWWAVDDNSLIQKPQAREAFLNIHFIQDLIRSLTVPGALGRISDPMSSAYQTWQKLCYIMGEAGPLPYNPDVPLPGLQIDSSVKIEIGLSKLSLWLECFSRWVYEPSSLPFGETEALLLPENYVNKEHWSHLYQMFDTLQSCLDQPLTNGMAS